MTANSRVVHVRPTGAALKREVRRRYASVAVGSSNGCGEGGRGCCTPSPTAAGVRELDLGCGNPLPFAGIRAGDTVLDLGSGSGAEVVRAARMVGPSGRAIGVDMTPEMVELSRRNAALSGVENAEFLEGDVEALPLPDESVDVIVSNCVLNLTPDKATAFHEAFRVLRPGGRFVVADVVVAGAVEPSEAWRSDVESWTACVRGAMTEEGYAVGLRAAGFRDVRLDRIAGYEACAEPCGEVEIVSDLIQARKPILEPLGARDLPAAARLLREAGLSDAGLDADALADGSTRLFGVRGDTLEGGSGDGDLLATAAWERGDGAVLVRSIAVRAEARGRGWGGRILEELLDRAREEGFSEGFLLTETAEAFFGARGWERVSRAEVDARFPRSPQVRSVCAASAAAMRRALRRDAGD